MFLHTPIDRQLSLAMCAFLIEGLLKLDKFLLQLFAFVGEKTFAHELQDVDVLVQYSSLVKPEFEAIIIWVKALNLLHLAWGSSHC